VGRRLENPIMRDTVARFAESVMIVKEVARDKPLLG